MDGIAVTAGVTKGALYHHFPGKEALYLAMMHADLRDKQALFQGVAAGPGTCRERLRRLTAAFMDLPAERRRLIRLVRRDINIFRNPARASLVRAYQAALPRQIETILRDGLRDGELAPADARLLSWLYVALVEVILTPYAERVLAGGEQRLDYVLNLFFEGAARSVAPGNWQLSH
jgi:AcrR family transcriptional regulator